MMQSWFSICLVAGFARKSLLLHRFSSFFGNVAFWSPKVARESTKCYLRHKEATLAHRSSSSAAFPSLRRHHEEHHAVPTSKAHSARSRLAWLCPELRGKLQLEAAGVAGSHSTAGHITVGLGMCSHLSRLMLCLAASS
ncbi:unnamed protein product [Effrenium voratum]|uniref:Uncharacterized protein n=1 Tax=Effrenium voratum TaxID=2562239 RepID=A0AA36IWV3_9DINO|nr:unnamed protein product [Effrenium voratum]